MSPRERFPRQVKYLIGNEACERFSFYGMKNILTFFMIQYMLLQEPTAKANFHLFVSAVYFFPLLGGILADRFWGKYRTIFWLSIIYCLGHLCLALFDDHPPGFYLGLALIALGSGGIKPCVASLMGDQFTERNKHLVKLAFGWFYWSINFGSFFATALIPKTLEWFGPAVAFGIPGILMAIATFIFWLGRKHYVDPPPTGRNPHSLLRVIGSALRARPLLRRRWLDAALAEHPARAIDAARSVLRVMLVFAPIPIFWALYDQKGSTWVVQATRMDLAVGPWTLAPSQLMALNPIMVMLLIPFTSFVLYPAIERLGYVMTPLRRMTLGMFVAGAAFAVVAALQYALDAGAHLSVLWQAVPYLVITLGEVLVSTTGLEFAYSQAPPEMKGTIMSFWNLTVTVGNLITAAITGLNVFTGGHQYLFWAVLIGAAGVAFGLLARSYVTRDWFQGDGREEGVPAASEAKGG